MCSILYTVYIVAFFCMMKQVAYHSLKIGPIFKPCLGLFAAGPDLGDVAPGAPLLDEASARRVLARPLLQVGMTNRPQVLVVFVRSAGIGRVDQLENVVLRVPE